MNEHPLPQDSNLSNIQLGKLTYLPDLQSMGKVQLTDVHLHNSCTTTTSHPVMNDDMRPAYLYFLSACMTGMCYLFCCGQVRKSLFA